MNEEIKKIALRMIPYGVYILTTADTQNTPEAATVSWVTQTSFDPPLVVVGVNCQSQIYSTIRKSNIFALNMLGKDQVSLAKTFSRPVERTDGTLGSESFDYKKTGAPILRNSIAYLDCKVVVAVEKGDHAIVIGEVVDADVQTFFQDRPDQAILELKDLGKSVFYGG